MLILTNNFFKFRYIILVYCTLTLKTFRFFLSENHYVRIFGLVRFFIFFCYFTAKFPIIVASRIFYKKDENIVCLYIFIYIYTWKVYIYKLFLISKSWAQLHVFWAVCMIYELVVCTRYISYGVVCSLFEH